MKKIENILVANRIESDKIVINKGANDGVMEYMRFLVFEYGNEIKDPVTQESLGILENPKGIFKVFHIQENMTVLISELDRPNKIANSLVMFSDVKVERDLLSTIKIGDKVKIINK